MRSYSIRNGFLFIATIFLILNGCSSGGDAASTSQITTDSNNSPTSTNTAASSIWNQMEWDNGTWSE